MQGTVWISGCASWYLDATGRNARCGRASPIASAGARARFDPTEYELRAAVPAPVPA